MTDQDSISVIDLEHQIDEWIEEAKVKAYRQDLYSAIHLLKRALKTMKTIRDDDDMQVAGLYGKLSILQRRSNNFVESKLSYNCALEIINKNRPNDAHADAVLEDSSRYRLEPVDRTTRKHPQHRKKKKRAMCSPKSPRTPRKHNLFNLSVEDVYLLPHYTMQHVPDGRIVYGVPIGLNQLTPRSRAACLQMGVSPDLLRIRDLHSFYLANPKMGYAEREERFVYWNQRRELLKRDLLEYREVQLLKKESDARVKKLQNEHASEAESFKVAAYGLAKTSAYDQERKLARSVIPTEVNHPFRGSVVAALSMLKTPVQTPNQRHRGRKPKIQAEPGALVCPVCSTVWDGKDRPECRICKKKIDWQRLYQENYERNREREKFLRNKRKLRRKREKEKKKVEDARAAVLKARQERKVQKWQAQCKKKKLEKWALLADGDKEETNDKSAKEDNPSSEEDVHEPDESKLGDFASFLEKTKAAAKAQKAKEKGSLWGVTREATNTTNESDDTSESDEDKPKDPSKFVETIPYGYAFPLLLSSMEREGIKTQFGGLKLKNMSAEEDLIRSIDIMTRKDVTKSGRRRHHHLAKARAIKKKKEVDSLLYLHSLTKPTKQPLASTDTVIKRSQEGFFAPPPAPKETTWATIQADSRAYENEKNELLLHKLKEDQKQQVADAKEMAKLELSNHIDRSALSTYQLLKNAKRQDDWFKMKDNLKQVRIIQELDYLQEAIRIDKMAQEQTNNFTLM